MQQYSKTHITTHSAAGVATQIATGPAFLKSITINIATDSICAVIDGTSGSTANVARIKNVNDEVTLHYDCIMATGIRIVTTGSSTISPSYTVTWSQ